MAGAGVQPRELRGRSAVLSAATMALKRTKIGNHAKAIVASGLRGVGKTMPLFDEYLRRTMPNWSAPTAYDGRD